MAEDRRGGRVKPAFVRPIGRLEIDLETVAECRALAHEISQPIEELAATHTTVSIERACLRLIGVDGVDPNAGPPPGVPLPNRVVDEIAAAVEADEGSLGPPREAVAS